MFRIRNFYDWPSVSLLMLQVLLLAIGLHRELLAGGAPVGGAPVDGRVIASPDGDVLAGVVIVKLRESASKSDPGIAAALASFSGSSFEKLFPFLDASPSKHSNDLRSIYLVRFEADIPPNRAAALLRKSAAVEYAVPYRVHRISGSTPAVDPSMVRFRLLEPNDIRYASQGYLPQIKAPEAWELAKGETGDVVIAVVDGGTEWRHPDLEANVWVNPNEIPDNGIDDDDNGFVDDVHGWNFANSTNDPTGLAVTPENAKHGTWVAGIAAAVTNNASGIASASWNARFMPINAGSRSAQFDNLLFYGFAGIVYAALNRADIINASWGGSGSPDPFEQDVIDFAYQAGSLVITSAGNENQNIDRTFLTPAGYNHVLTVGATGERNDIKAAFSNFGISVDVFAPGVNMLTTAPKNDYASPGGTSFSSPLVSAVAALVKTANPDYSLDQLREQVRVTADNIDAANISSLRGRLGRGRVNAFRALTETDWPAIRVAGVTFEEVAGNGDGFIQGGETIAARVRLTNFLAPATAIEVALATDDPLISINAADATIGSLAAGDTATVRFEFAVSDEAPQLHALRLTAQITAGSYRDRDLIDAIANPPAFLNHDTGALATSITAEGNIGWIGTAGDLPPFGAGFRYANNDLLFEGGLLIATASSRVSDAVRGTDQSVQEEDFVPSPDIPLQIIEPGSHTSQEGRVSLTDAGASSPIGVSIVQTSYADTAAAYRDFVIFKYVITNETSSTIENLYAGVFFDWDVSANGQEDYARYDPDRRMGFVGSTPSALLAGASSLLTTSAPTVFRAINNPDEIYDGFTPAEKWNVLRGGISTTSLDVTDASTLLGSGPHNLLPGCPIEVGFAILGARGLAALNRSADAAQDLWDSALRTPKPVNSPPLFTRTLEDVTIAEGEDFSFTYAAEDADPCDPTSFALLEAPQNTELDVRSGLFRFQPGFDQAGSHPVTVVFRDGVTADTARAVITVTNTNRTPVFTYSSAAFSTRIDTTVLVGQAVEFLFSAADPDDELLTFSLIGAPANATIDPASGLVRFTPLPEQAGTLEFEIQATDGQATIAASIHFTIIIPEFTLEPNYPNPFRPPTTIRIQVAERTGVSVRIYDVTGRFVTSLVDGTLDIGPHVLQWNGRTHGGSPAAAGLYFCVLTSDLDGEPVRKTTRMILLP